MSLARFVYINDEVTLLLVLFRFLFQFVLGLAVLGVVVIGLFVYRPRPLYHGFRRPVEEY